MKGLDLTLYLVAGSDGMDEEIFLKKIEDALRGGVTLLQLREKEKDALAVYRLALRVNELAEKYGVPLIVDDRADVALAVGAAGVHVGQLDLPVFAARKLLDEASCGVRNIALKDKIFGVDGEADGAKKTELKDKTVGVDETDSIKNAALKDKIFGIDGEADSIKNAALKDKIVGATAKTVEQALRAEREGADYVGVGAIYPTTTKVRTVLTPVSVLKDICSAVKIPAVAIGGLNEENSHVLRGSGFSGVAVVTAIMKADDPYRAARELKERIIELREKRE
jgi:thiamine-phosphate diphosphorylase